MDIRLTGPVRELTQRPSTADATKVKAARDFEAILLRQMLSGLEKTARTSGKGAVGQGNELHTSMMIEVLADALASAGGMGLSKMILEADAGIHAGSAGGTAVSKKTSQGSEMGTVHGSRSIT